jgi:hypothetical protein
LHRLLSGVELKGLCLLLCPAAQLVGGVAGRTQDGPDLAADLVVSPTLDLLCRLLGRAQDRIDLVPQLLVGIEV